MLAVHRHQHSWASFSQSFNQLFRRDVGLAENAGQGADFDFSVHRHNAALGLAFHDYVAAGLSHLEKTESFQRALHLRPRRHAAV